MTSTIITAATDNLDALPLHVSAMSPAQAFKFGELSATWAGAMLDACGFVADDALALAVLAA